MSESEKARAERAGGGGGGLEGDSSSSSQARGETGGKASLELPDERFPGRSGNLATRFTCCTRLGVLAAVSANFVNSYVLNQVFPYVGFMVVELEGGTKEQAGYKAGWLAAAFMLSRIPASLVWGFVGDLYGRRAVMLIGTFTMFFFSLVFGFSESYSVAVAARLLMGGFSGVVGTSKTVASELALHSPKEQAAAMNLISAAGALGMIAGPAISGLLYDPAGQYPGTALGSLGIFERFKFLLPNLVCACFALLSFAGIFFLVPETLPDPVPLPGAGVWSRFICFFPCATGTSLTIVNSSRSLYSALPQKGKEIEMSQIERAEAESISEQTQKPNSPPKPSLSVSSFWTKIQHLWRRNKVRKSAFAYALYSFIGMFFSEVFPLWLLAKKPVGGFEYGSKLIGFTISCSAVSLLLFQFFLFRLIATWDTPIRMVTVYLIASSVFYVQLPLTSLVSGEESSIAMAALIVQRSVQNILNQLTFNQLNLITNNSVATKDRATANGIVMGLGSVFKTLGPICAGSLFAWSVTNGVQAPPFNFYASFWTLAALCLALAAYVRAHVPVELNILHQALPDDADTC